MRAITGYSLAGLFAIYSLYRTSEFSKAASISGSMWFPRFRDFVFSHEMKAKPDSIYFSLGDRECRTKNRFLKTVQDDTEGIVSHLSQKGIRTTFHLNKGGHFDEPDERTVRGLLFLIDEE